MYQACSHNCKVLRCRCKFERSIVCRDCVRTNQGLGQVLFKWEMVMVLGIFWLKGILPRWYCFLCHRYQWASGIGSHQMCQIRCRNWLASLEGENKVVEGL